MIWRGEIFRIKIRKKEYDVLVRYSDTPSTTIEFKYDNCNLTKDVYLEDNITAERRYILLQAAIKDRIHEYNSMRYHKRLLKQRANRMGATSYDWGGSYYQIQGWR